MHVQWLEHVSFADATADNIGATVTTTDNIGASIVILVSLG